MARTATPWHVYLVRCADGTLYTGVALNVAQRIAEHNGKGTRGARYTRSRRPVKLAYQEPAANRSAACKREYRVKQLSRAEKLALIAGDSRMISAAKKKTGAHHGQQKSSSKKRSKKNC
jgi:putative endonuclease